MAKAKATRLKFLEFIGKREMITAYGLMDRFGYSYSYANKKLSLLKRQGLVQDIGDTPATRRGQWCLTERGIDRLRFLQQREKEQDTEVKRQEMLENEDITRLEKRVEELEELVKVFTGPGGLQGEVSRLLNEFHKAAAAYSQAGKLGIKPENIDFGDLTSRIEKLIRYSEYLPEKERIELQKELGLL
jgi:hypothetical protein